MFFYRTFVYITVGVIHSHFSIQSCSSRGESATEAFVEAAGEGVHNQSPYEERQHPRLAPMVFDLHLGGDQGLQRAGPVSAEATVLFGGDLGNMCTAVP